jgi:hypothetical protein
MDQKSDFDIPRPPSDLLPQPPNNRISSNKKRKTCDVDLESQESITNYLHKTQQIAIITNEMSVLQLQQAQIDDESAVLRARLSTINKAKKDNQQRLNSLAKEKSKLNE